MFRLFGKGPSGRRGDDDLACSNASLLSWTATDKAIATQEEIMAMRLEDLVAGTFRVILVHVEQLAEPMVFCPERSRSSRQFQPAAGFLCKGESLSAHLLVQEGAAAGPATPLQPAHRCSPPTVAK